MACAFISLGLRYGFGPMVFSYWARALSLAFRSFLVMGV